MSTHVVCRVAKLLDACASTPAAFAALLSSLPADKQPRLPALTRMLARLSKRGDLTKALALFCSLELLNVVPDDILAHTVIDLCCKWERGEEASRVIAALTRRGLRYSTSLYAGALSAVGRGQHIDPRHAVEVRRTRETMRSKRAACGFGRSYAPRRV